MTKATASVPRAAAIMATGMVMGKMKNPGPKIESTCWRRDFAGVHDRRAWRMCQSQVTLPVPDVTDSLRFPDMAL